MYEELGQVRLNLQFGDELCEVDAVIVGDDEPLPHVGISAVTIRRADGAPLSGAVLRSIKWQGLVTDALNKLVLDTGQQVALTSRSAGERRRMADPGADPFEIEHAERLRLQGPVDETLQVVARVYLAALGLGRPPARQVEISLGLPRTTASKWVRRARERGLLPTSETLRGEEEPHA